jgi:hypothetical protein
MESVLLARLGQLFNDERASVVVARLLFGLLDDLNLHDVILFSLKNGCVRRGLPQVLDGNVDQPGAQRALLLVRFLPIVLHDLSPSYSWTAN